VKIGDLVKYRYCEDWLGLIVRETPGTMKLKTVEWTHKSGGTDRGAYAEKDLELVSENR
jgi:hypothetical protein